MRQVRRVETSPTAPSWNRRRRLLWPLVALLAAACAPAPPTGAGRADAGDSSGGGGDAGTTDTGAVADGTPVADARPTADAGPAADAGATVDGGGAADAGGAAEAAPGADAGGAADTALGGEAGAEAGVAPGADGGTPPALIFSAQGNGYGNASELFSSADADFAAMTPVFNTVPLEPGRLDLVAAARGAGLQVILEFDYKWDFVQGGDITADVQDVVDQIAADPGSYLAVHMADRLNSWAEPASGRPAIPVARMIEYLERTGGVFHAQVPGLLVLVDVEDHELTCGQPGQSSCSSLNGPTSMYRHETNAVLTQLAATGYVDGFFIADNLDTGGCSSDPTGDSCWSPAAQQSAWVTARGLLPRPFIIVPRTSRLSFWQSTYPFDAALAQRQVDAAMRIPLQAGADGTDLWGWHIPWTDNGSASVRTWRNKDLSTNALWDAMAAAAAEHR